MHDALRKSNNDFEGFESRIEEKLAPLRDLGSAKLEGLQQ